MPSLSWLLLANAFALLELGQGHATIPGSIPPNPRRSQRRQRDFACLGVPDAAARAAWADLRTWIARVPSDIDIPLYTVVTESSIFGSWLESRRGASSHMSFDWCKPLAEHEECLFGRWAAWLLQAVERVESDLTEEVDELLRCPGGPSSASVLEVLFTQEASSGGDLPSWSEVAGSEWVLFGLLGRLRRALSTGKLLEKAPNVLRATVEGAAKNLPLLHSSSSSRVSAGASSSGPSLLWPEKVALTQQIESSLRAAVKGVGIGQDAFPGASALRLDQQLDIFARLHQLWLPDTILLRFPDAWPGFGRSDGQPCSIFRHGRQLHGVPREASVAAMTRSGGRRCGVAMRLLPREDHLTSTKVRATNELDCSIEVLQALKGLRNLRAQTHFGESPIHFADIGSNLGDCSLAASMIFPDGSLHALAVDADARVAPMLEASVRLNGLQLDGADGANNHIDSSYDHSKRNASKIAVRRALLGTCSDDVEAVVSLDAHIGVVGDGHEPADFSASQDGSPREVEIAHIRKSCLDREVSSTFPTTAVVDILAIHGNGYFETGILAGAEALLAGHRIHCILVTCVAHEEDGCVELESLLHSFNYRTERQQDWLAASPDRPHPGADGPRPCYAQDLTESSERGSGKVEDDSGSLHHPDL